MSAFPDTDTRYAEGLVARRVPREQWRNSQQWAWFYLHFCHKYRHRPADSKSHQLFLGKLASKGQTAEQRAHAQCAIAYYAVFLSPQLRSLRDDAVAPAASMPACMGTMAALSLMAVPFGSRGAGGPQPVGPGHSADSADQPGGADRWSRAKGAPGQEPPGVRAVHDPPATATRRD
jgi:hypothetical protein